MKSSFDIADRYLKPKSPQPTEPAQVDLTDGPIVAVLIDSRVLGAAIWLAMRDDWRPDEGDTTPVFYASELSFLRTKSQATLREVFKVKAACGGGMVRQ